MLRPHAITLNQPEPIRSQQEAILNQQEAILNQQEVTLSPADLVAVVTAVVAEDDLRAAAEDDVKTKRC